MMDLKIDQLLSAPSEITTNMKQANPPSSSDFKKVLGQSVDEMNQMLNRADQTTQEMVLGKKDIHEAMIAIEQAHVSLRLMIQVRNKIVAAYEEIMRMQM